MSQPDHSAPVLDQCGLCGGPLVRNPHPDAGKPETLTGVGYVWVCPPCITKAMSGWARRYHEAERKAARYREALTALNRYADGLRASNWAGLADVIEEALADV